MVDGPVVSAADFDGVVFDMDGVITDTAVVHRQAWQAMFDPFLAALAVRTGTVQRPFQADDYLRYVDGKQRADGVASFLGSRGVVLPRGSPHDPPGDGTVWALANRKDEAFQRVLATQGAKAFPSTVALVRQLQGHGIGTAVISASRNCQAVLDSAGIADLFAVRVDGLESARLALPGKPEPDVFLEAARRLRATPARSVVVEDALAGVQAGRDGGFGLVVGVDRVGQAAALREHGADVVVMDLGEVRVLP
jgi:alpha,alpha-trehalase